MKDRLQTLLAASGGLKFAHALVRKEAGPEADYFRELAAHVRDGAGLVTNVSVLHQGFEVFPHPSPAAPLWPLLLGHVARVIPLDLAAALLTSICWTVTLFFAWKAADALLPPPSGDGRWIGGFALTALLAIDTALFGATSAPLPHGLALAILAAGVSWLVRRGPVDTVGSGFVAGAALGAMVLASGGFAVVGLVFAAVHVTLVIAKDEYRFARVTGLAAAGSAFLATLTPQALRLAEWTTSSPWLAIVRFDAAREREWLASAAAFPSELALLAEIAVVVAGFALWRRWAARDVRFAAFVFSLAALAMAYRTLTTAEASGTPAATCCDRALFAELGAERLTLAVQDGIAQRIVTGPYDVRAHAVYEWTSDGDLAALCRLGVTGLVLDGRTSREWPVRGFVERKGWRPRRLPGGLELWEAR